VIVVKTHEEFFKPEEGRAIGIENDVEKFRFIKKLYSLFEIYVSVMLY
jgi:hypothetical protein